MKRAAVLIGVNKTGGGLPTLKAAAKGARAMGKWALDQGFDPDLVHVLTDDAGPVTIGAIKKAVLAAVDAGGEQLIVYFAGHGLNILYNEYWLLSDAPDDPQAVVNLRGSSDLARYGTIPHVVFASDACRTSASDIQTQGLSGSEIFPNRPRLDGLAQDVDIFYACALGRPALEVRPPDQAAAEFRAIYTDVLVEALRGRPPEVLTREEEADMGVVLPHRLKDVLSAEVTAALQAAQVALSYSQTPDALPMSRRWIARWPMQPVLVTRGGRPQPPPPPPAEVTSLSTVSGQLLRRALEAGAPIPPPGAAAVDGVAELTSSAARAATPFGPSHFESECGFKVRGDVVRDAVSRVPVEVLGPTVLRVAHPGGPAVDVLVELGSGRGVVLPALDGFVTGLTVDGDELVHVTYEPSEGTARWFDYQAQSGELRELRALVSASAQLGVFRLGDDAVADELAVRMQLAKDIDPAMAVYSAYAYDALGKIDRIRHMLTVLDSGVGFRPCDLALLAGELDGRSTGRGSDVAPFAPLLSQGWALLAARGVTLPPTLSGLAAHLLPSLWTLYDRDGVHLIRTAMTTEEI